MRRIHDSHRAQREMLATMIADGSARKLTIAQLGRRLGVARKTAQRWVERDYPALAAKYWPRISVLEAVLIAEWDEREKARDGKRRPMLSLPDPETAFDDVDEDTPWPKRGDIFGPGV